MFWYLLLALIALIVAAPFVYRARLRKPDRRAAPGKFARLSQGETHYRWGANVRGPVAVLIHGLTTPSPVLDVIGDGLTDTGYRVLSYDLYGRGWSSAPSGRQDRAFFLRQLDDLLASQEISGDVTLVGYSMGGSIATAWAAANPDKVDRVILIAPTGIETIEGDFERLTRRLPLIGDWLHAVAANARMTSRLMAERGRPSEIPGIVDIQLAELRREGFLTAVLSSRRGILSERQEADHRALGRADVPVIAIWGEEDEVVPIRSLGTLSQWNRAARQEVIPGAGHGLPHTHGTEIVRRLRETLRELVDG